MRQRAALVSLRFNPAFVQHLVAYAKALRELNFAVDFLLDPAYRQFPELEKLANVATDFEIPHGTCYTHALFLNVASQHRSLAARLKRAGARILYVYHEPWKTIRSYLKTDGIRSLLIGAAAHRVSLPLLRLADVVITGSEYALSTYRQNDARHNSNACSFPLIYDDEAGPIAPEMVNRKLYFSYVGSINRVHGFDQYIDVVRESILRDSDLRFLIASRSPLPAFVLKDKIIRSNPDKVRILCGRILQNTEINDCYASSLCVWNL